MVAPPTACAWCLGTDIRDAGPGPRRDSLWNGNCGPGTLKAAAAQIEARFCACASEQHASWLVVARFRTCEVTTTRGLGVRRDRTRGCRL